LFEVLPGAISGPIDYQDNFQLDAEPKHSLDDSFDRLNLGVDWNDY
jgi:hypothetical protein